MVCPSQLKIAQMQHYFPDDLQPSSYAPPVLMGSDQQIDYLPTIIDASNQLSTNGVAMITIFLITVLVREIRLLVVACKG
jgi:hypothetical protein